MATVRQTNSNNHTLVNFNTGELTCDPIKFNDILVYIEKHLGETGLFEDEVTSSYRRQFNALFTEIMFDVFNCELYTTKAICDTLKNVRTAVLTHSNLEKYGMIEDTIYEDSVFIKDSILYQVEQVKE